MNLIITDTLVASWPNLVLLYVVIQAAVSKKHLVLASNSIYINKSHKVDLISTRTRNEYGQILDRNFLLRAFSGLDFS